MFIFFFNSVPAGYGYGAPPNPGYSAPPNPGYGAPPNPGYGAPINQGYGAPPNPGYYPPTGQPIMQQPGLGMSTSLLYECCFLTVKHAFLPNFLVSSSCTFPIGLMCFH